MDLINKSNDLWTNEKHLNYLHQMETSFVRKMLKNDSRSTLTFTSVHHAPLDQCLPDCLKSTCDSKRQRSWKKEITSSTANDGRSNDKKMRRRCSRPYDVSQDQVVPQLATKSDRDEGRRNI
ncbi:hypothetical protein IFM89_037376 [Coptis chinensis]|uniref:Uncharacterized protein n=1 Tax=Coptis chinensis TaxID=261450 RepID=A0A835II16_9MAGN|nr:hypothetical protein IFM89_037376 [Coptis chinensis]